MTDIVPVQLVSSSDPIPVEFLPAEQASVQVIGAALRGEPGPPGDRTGMPLTVVIPLPRAGDDFPLFLSRSAVEVDGIKAVLRSADVVASLKLSIGYASGIKDPPTGWVVEDFLVTSQGAAEVVTIDDPVVPDAQQVRIFIGTPVVGEVLDLTLYLSGDTV